VALWRSRFKKNRLAFSKSALTEQNVATVTNAKNRRWQSKKSITVQHKFF
jgi:hypothetical protein